MSTTTIDARIRGYAQAVRLHLADLGPDVVDELTDGLEADLADAVADRSAGIADADGDAPTLDLAAVFGTASDYAAELRSAAGLPEAGDPARARGLQARARRLRTEWLRVCEPLTSSATWARLRDFALSLRPAGWVARGWILAALLDAAVRDDGWHSLVPRHEVALFWYLVAVVISVQWGRGKWMPWRWVKVLTLVATVAAFLGILPMADATTSMMRAARQPSPAAQLGVGSHGVIVDGERVQNIFPFDAEGRPLENVQLFDERGRPILTQAHWDSQWIVLPDGSWGTMWGTATDDGQTRWNIFPLLALPDGDIFWGPDGTPAPGTEPLRPSWPFRLAPATVPAPAGEDAEPGGAGAAEPDGAVPDDGPQPEVPDEVPADETEAPAPDGGEAPAPQGEGVPGEEPVPEG